jgi:stage II sporulation protein D
VHRSGLLPGLVSDGELREKWGGDYAAYLAKIADAVRSTDGECLAYENAPIQAVFHSSSAGMTAESGEVWAFSLPYLASVVSPETAETVPNYVSSVTVSASDFKETVARFYPDAVFPTDSGTWVTDITYTKSGRIGTLRLGGVTVSGPVLRTCSGFAAPRRPSRWAKKQSFSRRPATAMESG